MWTHHVRSGCGVGIDDAIVDADYVAVLVVAVSVVDVVVVVDLLCPGDHRRRGRSPGKDPRDTISRHESASRSISAELIIGDRGSSYGSGGGLSRRDGSAWLRTCSTLWTVTPTWVEAAS